MNHSSTTINQQPTTINHSPSTIRHQPSTINHLLAVAVCLLLGWSTWARGGTQVWFQEPMVWMGGLILGILVLNRFRCDKSEEKPLPKFLADPVIWAGLAFLVLLTVQWWNAGRYPYFHPFDHRWVFTPAPHPGWPSAVDRGDASEMLRWFFPAWTLMLAFRYSRRPDWLSKQVVWFLVINAGILAVFGIVQALSGTHEIFWVTPLAEHFFASFGYDNHAASFFALMLALSSGLLLQGISAVKTGLINRRRSIKRGTVVTASICAVLCLSGMVLSLSRAGMIMGVGLISVVLIVAVRLFWRRVSLAQRVSFVAAVVMGAAIFFFVISTMGGAGLLREVHKMTTNLDTRVFLAQSAVKVWQAEPWFGVGGWGYRHFVSIYAAEEPGRVLSLGHANTHNDTLQFLCEFGVVGFGLMMVAVWTFAWPLLGRIRNHWTPFLVLAVAGLLAVMIHSQIDLPFRSPGILYSWLAVLGASKWEMANG